MFDEPSEVVGDLLEDADEHHVLAAHMLELMQPHQHLAGMQSVGAAQILRAGTLRARFRLLLSPAK